MATFGYRSADPSTAFLRAMPSSVIREGLASCPATAGPLCQTQARRWLALAHFVVLHGRTQRQPVLYQDLFDPFRADIGHQRRVGHRQPADGWPAADDRPRAPGVRLAVLGGPQFEQQAGYLVNVALVQHGDAAE